MFMQVFSPATALWDQQTLFVVCGPGKPPRELVSRLGPLTDEGWTLVFPGWESPSDLRQGLEECRVRGLDHSRLVIAGMSEGERPAMELARDVGLPYLGVTATETLAVIANQALRAIPPGLPD